MKKKNISKSLLLMLLLMLSVILSSCAAGTKTPDELIKENFSGQEFNISFNSESLDKPLEDISYSANSIPKLPTPKKVGYIFEGWFFDKEYTMPYADAALKLTMQDVTLYPKWSKEEFEHNGTYAIEFDAKIVEGTVKKGKSTDVYGGYDDFCKALIKDECQIEKSNDKLLLKLQFDAGAFTPFQTNGQVFVITVNDKMGTDIYVKDKIDSLADKIKTIFIKIDDWDLSSTMYLDVKWTNYHDDRGLNEVNRYATTTTYEVAIDLTKIIGFDEAFANPNVPLEEGFYLAKSYFRKENNEESMGAVFNPVYSYLYSDGHEHYKLIKQNLPYTGLVQTLHPLYDPLVKNYYDRMLCFVSLLTVFDIDNAYSRETVESDYYPEIYNGGYYRRTVSEFHADEAKMYNIIDLDKDLTKEYIALTAVSGFMEVADGMGYIRQILSIDYDNLIKLPECDYKPLSGDFYEYESDFNFYPGYVKDLNKFNLTKDSINKFGMSIEMPNFYYEAYGAKDTIDSKTELSFSMEVTPTRKTSAIRLADSRNIIGEFNVNHKVFGYDVRNGKKLFLDRMNPQSFVEQGYNNQLRDEIEIKTGTDVKIGEIVNLEELFNKKINNDLEFIYVNYNAYEINNDKIDFTKPVSISREFKFTRDIAVEFVYDTEIGKSKTILELKDIPDPIITVNDAYSWIQKENYHFVKNTETKVGTTVNYPDVKYIWGNANYDFIQNFYMDEQGNESINPARTIQFINSDYQTILYLPGSHLNKFSITEENISILYEMQNEFRERQNLVFEYINKPREEYTITNDLGQMIVKNDVEYVVRDNIKSRVPVDIEITMPVIYDKFTLNEIRDYIHYENGIYDDYIFERYSIFSNKGNLVNQSTNTPNLILNNINSFISDKDYGVVYFYYSHGEDKIATKYLFNVTFSGESDFNVLNHKTYFSNTEYTIDKNFLVGSNMERISNMELIVKKLVNGRVSDNWNDHNTCRPIDEGMQYKLKFLYPGEYLVTVKYNIKNEVLDVNDQWASSYSFNVVLNVKNNVGDVKIIYKTDANHPFKGGEVEKVVNANLGDGVTTLGIDVFDNFEGTNKTDGLYQWVNDEGFYSAGYAPNSKILGKDFISKFGSDEVVFKAKWEHKFSVTCHIKEGVDPIKIGAYIEYGNYKIPLPNVKSAYIPKGYVFAGWTGGFIGSDVRTGSVYLSYSEDFNKPENYPEGYFDIQAVFKKIHQVTFDIDTTIAEPIRSTTAIDGGLIKDAEDKYLIQIVDKSYGFVGWKVKGSSKILTKKEFLNYKVYDDTVFEAVLAKKHTINVEVDENIALPVPSFNGYHGHIIMNANEILNLDIIDNNYGIAGFFVKGDESQTLIDLDTFIVNEDITLVGVFAKKHVVKVEVDKNIAAQLRSIEVLEGYVIPDQSKNLNIKMFDNAYKFLGFYVKGDADQTLIDLNTFVVNEDMTLVAKFEKLEVTP